METKMRKKWKSKKAVIKCLTFSLALMIIVWLLKLAELVFAPDLSYYERTIFFFFDWALLALTIWFIGYVNPSMMEVVFGMLGFGEEENQSEDSKEGRKEGNID